MHLQLLGDELGVPVRGLARRSAALGRPLEGWRLASKRLGALPRIRRGALGRGCGMEGSGALPLPRAAVISTRLRVLAALDRHELLVTPLLGDTPALDHAG